MPRLGAPVVPTSRQRHHRRAMGSCSRISGAARAGRLHSGLAGQQLTYNNLTFAENEERQPLGDVIARCQKGIKADRQHREHLLRPAIDNTF